MRAINPSRIFSGQDRVQFQLSRAVFLMAYVEGKGAVGQCLGATVDMSACVRDLVKKAREILGAEEMRWKLVGLQALVENVSAILQRQGETVEKTVPQSGDCEILFYADEARMRLAAEAATVVAAGNSKIKVLVVDDSKTIRSLLTKIFSADPNIEVVAEAERPSQVEALIAQHKPDVITLDIHMPEMDGVTLLQKYIIKYPIPTVMISSISMEEGPKVLSALESGAVDYIQKPKFEELRQAAPLIIEKVKIASRAQVKTKRMITKAPKSTSKGGSFAGVDLIVIGSSTGGTEAIREVLTRLPENIPPIAIVQHIPPVFSKAFSQRMNELCPFGVKEAEDGDILEKNQVYIAPGGKQMRLKKRGDNIRIVIEDGPPVNRHKPSVEPLFDSVPSLCFSKTIAVMLTGMGSDGAQAMKRLHEKGVYTLAQNEATCIVYGMPKAAVECGAVDKLLPIEEIGPHLAQGLRRKAA